MKSEWAGNAAERRGSLASKKNRRYGEQMAFLLMASNSGYQQGNSGKTIPPKFPL